MQINQASCIAVLLSVLALGGCSPSESKWKQASQENSVAAYEAYLQEFPDSTHVAESQRRIEQIQWDVAFSTRDEKKRFACIEKYPNSANVERAREEIWVLKWPAVKVEKANSVTVFSAGSSYIMGEILYPLSGFFGGPMKPPEPGGAYRIFIWRDFSAGETEAVAQLGLRPGLAYLKTEAGEFKFVRKVDVKLSNEELAGEFGVNVKK